MKLSELMYRCRCIESSKSWIRCTAAGVPNVTLKNLLFFFLTIVVKKIRKISEKLYSRHNHRLSFGWELVIWKEVYVNLEESFMYWDPMNMKS